MRHGPSVWTRMERVEERVRDVALQREVARVAEAMAVDPGALLAEAHALLKRARAAGARSDAEVTAFALRERGMTPETSRAKLAGTGACR